MYADDAGTEGTFEVIRHYLDDFMMQGNPHGYFPEPTKSVLVISPRNVLKAEVFFRGYRLQIVTWGRYLGGFVGSKETYDCWLG